MEIPKFIPAGTPIDLWNTHRHAIVKSACIAAAIGAAGVALNYFLQSPSDVSKEQLEALQLKIGEGTREECLDAFSNYPLANTDFRKIVDAVGGVEAYCGLLRGTDRSSSHLFFLLQTSERTEVTQLPESKVAFADEKTYLNTYFQQENSWALESCSDAYHCQTSSLNDRDIEDLGRLVRGEVLCKSTQENEWISTEICRRLI